MEEGADGRRAAAGLGGGVVLPSVSREETGVGWAGLRLGWARPSRAQCIFFKNVPRKIIRRKINKSPKKIKQIFPV